jgi:receptor protein-tyrosine kinase/non-specific protein-tyrosine kinase
MTTAVDLRGHARQPAKNGTTVVVAPAGLARDLPLAYEAEQYRVLAHVVEQLGRAGRKVIAISSPVAGDGKTITSINLARTLAQASESRILLVDADLRRGSLGRQLGVGRATSLGLAGAIADPGCPLEGVVRRRPAANLSVLPAGACPSMPYETLRSPRVGVLFAEARDHYDYVIVDTPPVVPVADLRALSQWVDGILLVVSAHYTPRPLFDEALSALDPEKVVGIVYNGDDLPLSRRYRNYYSYGEPEPRAGFWASLLGLGGRR